MENSSLDNSVYSILLQQFKKNKNIKNEENYNLTQEDIRELFNPANYPEYAHEKANRNLVIIAFYSSIVLVSLFGNLLVCYVIFKKKRMRTKTNILMANLTVSDLMMTIFNIPFNIARLLLDDWPFGSALCMFVPLVQVTSVYVSTYSMTIIAIDRYQAIINPLHRRLSNTVPIGIIILFIWIVASVFSIPNVVFNRVVEIPAHKLLTRCRAIYPSPPKVYRQAITMFTFITQYVIPLSITAFAYIRISINIWFKLSQQSDQQKAREKSRRKTIKMLAIVVVVFSICWLPLSIFHIRSDFSNGYNAYDTNIFFICHWFAMSSVCYNPFIYFWLNKHYRQETKNIIRCGTLNCYGSALLEPSSSSSSAVCNLRRSNAVRLVTTNATPKTVEKYSNNDRIIKYSSNHNNHTTSTHKNHNNLNIVAYNNNHNSNTNSNINTNTTNNTTTNNNNNVRSSSL